MPRSMSATLLEILSYLERADSGGPPAAAFSLHVCWQKCCGDGTTCSS
jgi:hypothetical protein